MTNKLLAGFTKPRIEYLPLKGKLPEPEDISRPQKATLLLNDSLEAREAVLLKPGDAVRTGQKLALSADSADYVISSVTGTISALEPHIGNFGWTGTAVTIDVAEEEAMDETFAEAAGEPSLDTALRFLAGIPGAPRLSLFSNPDKPIHTILISAVDKDMLVTTQQFILQTGIEKLAAGIRILKQISGIEQVVLVVPVNVMTGYGHIGADVRAAGAEYPSGFPHMIMKEVMGQVVPEGKSCEDLGVAFFSAEAAASIGTAFEEGRIPETKLITLINKSGDRKLISARIGTPIRQIFKAANISPGDRDRIIFGGPMTGLALYSEDLPVQADTDALMIQDKSDLPAISDYPCINCGQCIRSCPVNIPVNMLVRFLEAGQYEAAADEYDLYACIECGLCSYVCVSRIPIFQYIKLAKYEIGRALTVEAANA